MGMPHRGRLNLLCNLLHKPAGLLFGELKQAVSEFHIGDVQYHQGQASTLTFPKQARHSCSASLVCLTSQWKLYCSIHICLLSDLLLCHRQS